MTISTQSTTLGSSYVNRPNVHRNSRRWNGASTRKTRMLGGKELALANGATTQTQSKACSSSASEPGLFGRNGSGPHEERYRGLIMGSPDKADERALIVSVRAHVRSVPRRSGSGRQTTYRSERGKPTHWACVPVGSDQFKICQSPPLASIDRCPFSVARYRRERNGRIDLLEGWLDMDQAAAIRFPWRGLVRFGLTRRHRGNPSACTRNRDSFVG